MKKNLISKEYIPKDVEGKWNSFWEKNKFFKTDIIGDKPGFCIIMPPPNITGILHMGHALINTLQDIIIRFKRMQNYEVLWIPGIDHAGISTQTVVEKDLIMKMGKRRCDFDRETFLKYVWQWKHLNEEKIIQQIKLLGCSCDWSRSRFTMDKQSNIAVKTLFKKMYDDNLIYRGDYIVNWDTTTRTALADDEVEYLEKKSSLWYFKYPLKSGGGSITIATTRPETMLGDVAVAVHPEDSRYKKYVGESIILPIVNKEIPIIADKYVKRDFGSGAVKITPAHDVNDWEIGKRHNLPIVNILNPDGKLNKFVPEYEGVSMENARKLIVDRMKLMGLLEKIEPYVHQVGISYRSKAIIEPYLSKQWFIKMKPFKQKLIDAVKDGKVKLIPKHWENTYFHWVENIRDWCISRQLWWGHRIPIWHHKSGKTICYIGDDLPEEVSIAPEDWVRDKDVLDTWFSSALWPFSALGWPEQTNELKTFYPNSTLITGHDIIFFWVARMVMMGEYVMGEVPFKEVSLHGLIYSKSYFKEDQHGHTIYCSLEDKRKFDLGSPLPKDIDSKWEKMSKSKCNVIDPLEIMDLYGTDAMRISLASNSIHKPQIDLDYRRFEEFKNFINKVWNGYRYIYMNITISSKDLMKGLEKNLNLEDLWILGRLQKTIIDVGDSIDKYSFDFAINCCYNFFWNEFCSYYLEISKYSISKNNQSADNKQKILLIVLMAFIRIMHPFAPFITEEIFASIKDLFLDIKPTQVDVYTKEFISAILSRSCALSPFPNAILDKKFGEVEKQFNYIKTIVYKVRNIRSQMNLRPKFSTDIIFNREDILIKINSDILRSLLPIEKIHFDFSKKIPSYFPTESIDDLTIIIPLSQELIKEEKLRLQKAEVKLSKTISMLKKNLNNTKFLQNAPKELIDRMEKNLRECDKNQVDITKKLSSIKDDYTY